MTQKRKKKAQHLLCRPPKGATEVERWTGRVWKKDDGKPGLAFSYLLGTAPHAGSTRCAEWCPDFGTDCIFNAALHHTCDRWGGANGALLQPFRLQVAR